MMLLYDTWLIIKNNTNRIDIPTYVKHICIKRAISINPYAIVYPFFTSGQTAAMKKATITTAKPNVINRTNKIKNGVLVNKSN